MKNLHYLLTEIYKVENNVYPDIMRDIFHFQENENCNLRGCTHFTLKKHEDNIVWKDTVSILGAKIWSPLPEEL